MKKWSPCTKKNSTLHGCIINKYKTFLIIPFSACPEDMKYNKIYNGIKWKTFKRQNIKENKE